MTNDQIQAMLALRELPRDRGPVMYQKWKELLFLHWEYEPEVIQKTLPAGLFVDTFQGRAYLGIVPFFMCDIRPRFCPALPGISNFQEVNVRTYVVDSHGTPGVWFYSLDANQRLAVWTARTFFSLPYHFSTMTADWDKDLGSVKYNCARAGKNQDASHFVYRSEQTLGFAEPGSFEFFLVERYLLFTSKQNGSLCTGRVYHTPYPLVAPRLEKFDTTLLRLAGFAEPGRAPDHCAMSRGVMVKIFALERLLGSD